MPTVTKSKVVSTTVSLKDLQKTLGIVKKAIAPRPSHPILATVKIEMDGTQLSFEAFNAEYGIVSSIPCTIGETWATCVVAKQFVDLVNKLTADEVTLELQESQLLVKAGKSKYSFEVMPSDEWPEIPTPDKDRIAFTDELKGAIAHVSYCYSKEAYKGVIKGVHVGSYGKKIVCAATDGHRLSYTEIEVVSEVFETMIPGEAIALFKGLQDWNEIVIEREGIWAYSPNARFYCRALEGQYPMVKQLIPVKFQDSVIFDKDELLAALERVKLLAAKNLFTMVFADSELGTATLIPKGAELSEEIVTANWVSDRPFACGFDVNYLIDGLKAVTEDLVKIGFNPTDKVTYNDMESVRSPVVISSGDGYPVELIMPAFVH
jgi:DNA polymerase-3 subunit beta